MATGADAMMELAVVQARRLAAAGRIDEALAGFSQAMAMAPASPTPYLAAGRALMTAGRFDEALYCFDQAIARAPGSAEAKEGAGEALLALGRAPAALEIFTALRSGDPRTHIAWHRSAEALSQLGRLADAREALEQAVRLAPDVVGHHYALAQLARFTPDDPRLAPLERLGAKAARYPEPDRCELYFALGKAYDDLGRHDAAFRQFAAGNALRRRAVRYDEAGFLGILQALETAFTPEAVTALAGSGHPAEEPVFIVGMPRSGTSLVEQILASHPQVFGAGEQMILHQLLGQGLLGPDFPAGLARLKPAALHAFGGHYAMQMKALAPAARRIVDKLPANFMLCGLIHLALPNARIIHVKRDPLDTCFSCYANLFAQAIDYSYDLGELGRYYRGYETLMDHWQRVLPAGAILEVSYESLVGNLEAEARRILTHIGLDWDAACLSFHRTARVVHTLSAAQVRQPVYASAVGRAAPYAPYLAPLRRALGLPD